MTDQEHWDACLIKTWRSAGRILDALQLFNSTTGKWTTDCNLLRVPRPGYPWKIGVRVFVASHLSKISDRLWEQPPEKDALLLKKLATSNYDTAKQMEIPQDIELKKKWDEVRHNHEKIKLLNEVHHTRNQATDWNVNKGPARTRRLKR